MTAAPSKFLIGRLNAEQRLDKFLFREFPNAPKSFLYRALREKRVTLNGKKAEGGAVLKEGDTVRFYLPPEKLAEFRNEKRVVMNAPAPVIIFEDENVIICDKPAGRLVHGEGGETLTGGVIAHVGDCYFTPAPAHRLDRNTSGLVVFAKNLPSAQWLASAFAERKVEKFYIAVVEGVLPENRRFESFLKKDAAANKVFEADDGKFSVTEVEPVKVDKTGKYTVLRIKLLSGRTHQIRAQLAAQGFPLVGDAKYGGKGRGYLLHAHTLTFTETGGFLGYLGGRTFEAALPKSFSSFICST